MVSLPQSAPPSHSHRTANFLWLWDVLIFAVITLLTWVVFSYGSDPAGLQQSQTSVQRTLLNLWIMAGVLAYLLTNQFDLRRYFFQPTTTPLLVPITAFLLTGLFFAAIGQENMLWRLLPLHLLWLGLSALRQFAVRRITPPLRLGMTARPHDDLLRHLRQQHLEYVPISPQEPQALQQVDALVVEAEQPTPLQRRVLAHAQVMNIPVITQRILEEELTGKVSLNSIDQDWLQRSAFQSTYRPWKRFFDVACTLLALPALLPLMLVVAAVVYFNSGRPILFWQERVGRDGQPFQLVKFRTMTRDSERSGPAFAKQGDQRVTPVGAFLRKFRLDELPQFWNVLRGEMSIIGPRPEQWAFAAEFEESIPLYGTRHWVRPGITGWAQVNQGYTDSVGQTTEKLQYDFFYVKHCSLSTDLLIVWKTILTILTGFGSR